MPYIDLADELIHECESIENDLDEAGLSRIDESGVVGWLSAAGDLSVTGAGLDGFDA